MRSGVYAGQIAICFASLTLFLGCGGITSNEVAFESSKQASPGIASQPDNLNQGGNNGLNDQQAPGVLSPPPIGGSGPGLDPISPIGSGPAQPPNKGIGTNPPSSGNNPPTGGTQNPPSGVIPTLPPVPAAENVSVHPVYRGLGGSWDHFSTLQTANEGIVFYALDQAAKGRHAISSCYHWSNKWHEIFSDASADCQIQAPDIGVLKESLGYLFDDPAADRLAVYRCYRRLSKDSDDHMDTTQPTECAQNFYSVEGILGYAPVVTAPQSVETPPSSGVGGGGSGIGRDQFNQNLN